MHLRRYRVVRLASLSGAGPITFATGKFGPGSYLPGLQAPGHFTAPLAIIALGESQYQVFCNLIDTSVVIISMPIALLA